MRHLCVLVLCLIVAACQAPGRSSERVESIDEQILFHAEAFTVSFAKDVSGRLDYSEKSLEVLDELLDRFSSSSASVSASDRRLLVAGMSAYVLEVAHRQYGGAYYWFEDDPVLVVGEPVYHLALQPNAVVQGRFLGDPGADIPFFYQGFKNRIGSAQPGSKVLYQ